MNFVARLLLLALLAVPLWSQSGDDVERVMDEALKPSPLAGNLRRLTDEIGGRMSGSPVLQQAVTWATAAFRAAGADSVRVESFEIPRSWSEGDTCVEVTSPARFRARAVSVAWAPPLQARDLRVVDIGNSEDPQFPGDFRDAVLLVHSKLLSSWDDLFHEYLDQPPIIARAVQGKAAAILWLSSREHDLLYRHIINMHGEISPPLPMVVIAREDGERIARLLTTQEPLRMSISMPNQVGGPMASSNVIAELRGDELPDEWVLVGAHLDSWELGTGALDDGCNAGLVIDTLRAIEAAGIRPRRSLRFALFSGEEQGTLGSWAYVRGHDSEMDKADAVVVFDEGTGRVTGYSVGGRKDVVPALTELLRPLARFQATQFTTDAFIGTDNYDFLLEGVPTLVANQEPANYLVNYHASSDTYDKVDLGELKRQVAISAATVVAIANAPGRLGPRQSRAAIEQLIGETHLDDQMKLLGMWDEWLAGKRGRAK